MDNTYIFILDNKGIRITSLVVGVHAKTEKECLDLAKSQYNEYNCIVGTESMQKKFLENKRYVNGEFLDIEVEPYVPSKSEKIAEIKSYYTSRFSNLEQIFLKRRLINGNTDDLTLQYQKLNSEMLAKIKEVK